MVNNSSLPIYSFSRSPGNPHNQLAVVATYNNQLLNAVHRYFRSVAVRLCCCFCFAFICATCRFAINPSPQRCKISSSFSRKIASMRPKQSARRQPANSSLRTFCLRSPTWFTSTRTLSSFMVIIRHLSALTVESFDAGILYTQLDLTSFEALEKSLVMKLEELFFAPMREVMRCLPSSALSSCCLSRTCQR